MTEMTFNAPSTFNPNFFQILKYFTEFALVYQYTLRYGLAGKKPANTSVPKRVP